MKWSWFLSKTCFRLEAQCRVNMVNRHQSRLWLVIPKIHKSCRQPWFHTTDYMMAINLGSTINHLWGGCGENPPKMIRKVYRKKRFETGGLPIFTMPPIWLMVYPLPWLSIDFHGQFHVGPNREGGKAVKRRQFSCLTISCEMDYSRNIIFDSLC